MKKSNLVYSTDQGRLCPECEQALENCNCQQNQILGDGKVSIKLETKGRKGKGVTLVQGLALTLDDMKILGKKLKAQCGTGGAVKDGAIEIQGDNRQKIKELLLKEGFSSKITG
ncbi:translation initiation factor [Marinomonas sp. C1424]|uniref:Translation initiation factor n=2 Tax=Marinomonas transparens TaxID=2795388 RepID=A0A934JL82_9GAMM|nr:translation initiation factor [Marinomonas transparens]